MVVGVVNSDNVLLQQPISQEHSKLLLKICEDIKLDPGSLYITNILKCESKSPKVSEYKACYNNLNSEIHNVRPSIVILCGHEVKKRFLKMNPEILLTFEFDSLHTAFSGRDGIIRFSKLLEELKVYV